MLEKHAKLFYRNKDLTADIDPSKTDLTGKVGLREYHALDYFKAREEYHARLESIRVRGGIKIAWDTAAGEHNAVSRITLVDPQVLGVALGVPLPWVERADAIERLTQSDHGELESVELICEQWRSGKTYNGLSIEHLDQILDALKVYRACEALGTHQRDYLLRRLSIDLFGDSKRIERLAPTLSKLLGLQDVPDLFASMGLVKYPQPLLLHGPSSVSVITNSGEISLHSPYLGLRPDTITGARYDGEGLRLVTIENLASFNEATDADIEQTVLLYVAGNPTPSTLEVYRRLINDLQPVSIYHWGDIDLGGFRIAHQLARVAETAEYRLSLVEMCSRDIESVEQREGTSREITEIEQLCGLHRWTDEAEALNAHSLFLEQEYLYASEVL